jgi:hypothetical protein
MDPCGTPYFTGLGLEMLFPIHKYIYISNENIQNVNIQKLLGIYLDHNLDWKNQIDYICKNISSRLFLFTKIKKYLDQKCKILFFNSYFLLTSYYLSQI